MDTMTPQGFGRRLAWLGVFLISTQCAGGGGPLSPAAAQLRQDEAAFLARQGQIWVEAQRQLHRPHAVALSDDEKQQLVGFFSNEVLDQARIRVVNRIENPDFYAAYEELDKRFPLDFASAVGLALVDTVLIRRSHAGPGTESRKWVLFHELVHLEQYRLVGPENYIERYIRALAEGGFDYRSNPFEAQAFELQNRYRRRPEGPFVVEDEVSRRFAASVPN
ncbi:MAG: hypothetical protein AAF657_24340 [Acidobacteriota bacterium]